MLSRIFLLVSTEAVGTDLFLGKPDGFDQIVQTVVTQRGEVELLTDPVHHLLILLSVGVGIFLKSLSVGARKANLQKQ